MNELNIGGPHELEPLKEASPETGITELRGQAIKKILSYFEGELMGADLRLFRLQANSRIERLRSLVGIHNASRVDSLKKPNNTRKSKKNRWQKNEISWQESTLLEIIVIARTGIEYQVSTMIPPKSNSDILLESGTILNRFYHQDPEVIRITTSNLILDLIREMGPEAEDYISEAVARSLNREAKVGVKKEEIFNFIAKLVDSLQVVRTNSKFIMQNSSSRNFGKDDPVMEYEIVLPKGVVEFYESRDKDSQFVDKSIYLRGLLGFASFDDFRPPADETDTLTTLLGLIGRRKPQLLEFLKSMNPANINENILNSFIKFMRQQIKIQRVLLSIGLDLMPKTAESQLTDKYSSVIQSIEGILGELENRSSSVFGLIKSGLAYFMTDHGDRTIADAQDKNQDS